MAERNIAKELEDTLKELLLNEQKNAEQEKERVILNLYLREYRDTLLSSEEQAEAELKRVRELLTQNEKQLLCHHPKMYSEDHFMGVVIICPDCNTHEHVV